MEILLLHVSVALLFLSSIGPIRSQTAGTETELSVAEGAPLAVECALRVEARAEWLLNGSGVPADMAPAESVGGARLVARLRAPAARAHHAGLYTCSRDRAAPRVRVRVVPPAAHRTPPAGADEQLDEGGLSVVYYNISRNLTLNCSLTTEDKTLTYVWKKNDVNLEEVPLLKNRYKLENGGAAFVLTARAVEDDYGNYSCALGGGERAWEVRGRPVLHLPDNTNVVEGQKLKLQCRVTGKPYPRVTWTYSQLADDANATLPPAEGARLERSEQGVEGGALVLDAAARAHAGTYACRAAGAADSTTLRVKDMYAALWPFLGICAEVFVLCAIILVYERRRTKPEVDDSDTDNHDQKKS